MSEAIVVALITGGMSLAGVVATCLATATTKIRNCSTGVNGARAIYDGCFLR